MTFWYRFRLIVSGALALAALIVGYLLAPVAAIVFTILQEWDWVITALSNMIVSQLILAGLVGAWEGGVASIKGEK